MNKQNQDRADKVAHVYKKSRKVRIADEVLKRALTDCMQEEANQVQKKMEREGQHAFSKPFIEKMQFVLKQGKQAEKQQKKKYGAPYGDFGLSKQPACFSRLPRKEYCLPASDFL